MTSIIKVDFTKRHKDRNWKDLPDDSSGWWDERRQLSPGRYTVNQQTGIFSGSHPVIFLGISNNATDVAYKSNGGLILKSSSSDASHPSSFGVFIKIPAAAPFHSIRVDTAYDWLDVDLDIATAGGTRFKGAIDSLATTKDISTTIIEDADTMVAVSCQTAYDVLPPGGPAATAIKLNGPKLFVVAPGGAATDFAWTPFDSLRCSPIFGPYAGNNPAAVAPSSLEIQPFILSMRMEASATPAQRASVGLQLAQDNWDAPPGAPVGAMGYLSTRFHDASEVSKIQYAGTAIHVTKPSTGVTHLGPIAARIQRLTIEIS